ncbi:putative disease resistance protein [Camellia lanceoleosa]|uniref:Disease resistance protein n=1 Tax=Camellia lanceoleosa TaxID=1840588 RepID=A0ACC0FUE8_9ERIC|nr:putative disease resistance protein [Camellia lanceoleosa]
MKTYLPAVRAPVMEEKRILKLLKDEGSKTIVLVGKPGSGKTWMAKKLSARATREGYFGHIDCVEKTYEEGHRVLMELIDCRLLKKADADCIIIERSVEADYILMERAMLSLEDCHRCGFNGISHLGLADLFEDGEWGGLGKITQAGGMIKAPCSGKKGKLSTLLLDGNRLCSEVLNKFCQSNLELQALAILHHT